MYFKVFNRAFVTFSAGCLFSLPAIAQEENSDAEPSTVENAAMNIVVASDDESGGPPVVISAMSSSVNGAPAVFSVGGPGASLLSLGEDFGPMDPLGMIHNPDVQKEIELDAEQLDAFKEANAEFQKKMQAQTLDLRNGKIDREKMKAMSASIKALQDEQTSRIKKILVPHQLERLEQISTQQYMDSAGTAAALANKKLAEQLGLSKEQLERIKQRSEEVSKELTEKIEQLKQEGREKILSELTSEQREKITQLTGKKYTFKFPEFEGIRKRIRSRANSESKAQSSDASEPGNH
jgi:hypothetical protein